MKKDGRDTSAQDLCCEVVWQQIGIDAVCCSWCTAWRHLPAMGQETKMWQICDYQTTKYNTKMGGVDMADRMISYYRMSVRTKKSTLRMLMHFTDVALANSWLLYCQDLTVHGTPRRGIMQFLEFQMEVAKTFLAQHNNVQDDNTDFSEQENDTDLPEPGKKCPVKAVPHISVRRRANAHLPVVVNLKNVARCRATGCSGKTRVQCATCKVFLCLQAERTCYTAFHKG